MPGRSCGWCVWRPPVFWAPCGFSYWSWPLCVPVGGGPPACRPRGELRSACRLVVRPVSASAPRHSNFARNSPAACSNIEFVSLELQRFRVVLKNDRGELCATFAGVVIAVTLDPLLAAGAVARPFGPSGFSGALQSPRQPMLALPTGRSLHRGRFLRRPPVPSALVGLGVLSWLAPTLPRVRYKILPAWLLGGENGTKLSLHAQIAPHWAISGERGEFCTGSGPAWLVLGEFCLASGPDVLASGDLCPNLSPRVSPARSYASPNGAIHPDATCRSARGRGPGRSQQQMSSDN